MADESSETKRPEAGSGGFAMAGCCGSEIVGAGLTLLVGLTGSILGIIAFFRTF